MGVKKDGATGDGAATRFKPGQSGNPGGRPSRKLWTDALKDALGIKGDDPSKAKELKGVAKACVEAAMGGDVTAMKEIGDRLEGKPAQAIVGEGGGPVAIEIVHTFQSKI